MHHFTSLYDCCVRHLQQLFNFEIFSTYFRRHERLHDIREVFYKTYFATVGVVERDESIGALFNNFVGRVGLVPLVPKAQ